MCVLQAFFIFMALIHDGYFETLPRYIYCVISTNETYINGSTAKSQNGIFNPPSLVHIYRELDLIYFILWHTLTFSAAGSMTAANGTMCNNVPGCCEIITDKLDADNGNYELRDVLPPGRCHYVRARLFGLVTE